MQAVALLQHMEQAGTLLHHVEQAVTLLQHVEQAGAVWYWLLCQVEWFRMDQYQP